MKKILIGLAIVFALALAAFLGGLALYHNNANNPWTQKQGIVQVTVNPKEGLHQVLDRLAQEGELKNAQLSKLYFSLSGVDTKILPGAHRVDRTSDLKSFVATLNKTDESLKKVTIAEGLNFDQICQKLDEAGIAKKEDLLKAEGHVAVKSYVPEKGQRRHRLEGYLAPTTYSFEEKTAAKEVLQAMHEEFDRVQADLKKQLAQEEKLTLDRSLDEILIKASIIERETSLDSERFMVSAVINNRLTKGMKLQMDATVLYAKNEIHENVSYNDLTVDSPYNTYLVEGLPVGPICMPSLKAIQAVLKPAKTDALFYVLNPETGRHFFTPSDEIFEEKKKRYYNTPVTNEKPSMGPQLFKEQRNEEKP